MPYLSSLADTWRCFTPPERRNIAIYIVGIVLYKFGLEAFNGSIIALATNRYDFDAAKSHTPSKTFARVGLLTGLNQAFQCVGAILIAPLVRRFPTRNVLSGAVLVFGVFTAILLIVDAATGGTIKPRDWARTHKKDDFGYYGTYNTDGIILIYCITGVAYGMVELIRRVIPRDIVGTNVQKLRRMDAVVHMFNEIAGTGAAFATALGLIPRFGNNFSFFITPVFFGIAALVWSQVSDLGFSRKSAAPTEADGILIPSKTSYLRAILSGFIGFGESVYIGAKLVLTNRKFFWLLPGYSIALYGHRFLEGNVSPAVARRYLGNSAWSQIINGGSNLGELLGDIIVLLTPNLVRTPIPWLRFDSLSLLILWYIPYYYPPSGNVNYAWRIAASFIPVSMGWSAGDVSLTAYIQALISRVDFSSSSSSEHVSALGAVMAFLYSTQIVIYAITSPLLGRYIDKVYNRTGGSKGGDIHSALVYTTGVQFTIISAVVMAATFIPKGALKVNPDLLYGETLEAEATESASASKEANQEKDSEIITDEKFV